MDDQNLEDLSPLMAEVGKEYPPIGAQNIVAARLRDPGSNEGYAETYPAWETYNPNPGKHTIHVFDQTLNGDEVKNLLAGESLHILGSVNPETGQPLDKSYRTMRDEFLNTLTPEQLTVDRLAYAREKESGKETRDFSQFMDQSRLDAYLRGYLFPDKNDYWRDVYNDTQRSHLEKIRQYLKNGNRKK